MTRAQGLLVVLTSVLLLAWLAGSGRAPQSRLPSNPAWSRIHSDVAVSALGEQAARLRAHLSGAQPLPPSRRNPFQFGASAAAAGRARQAAVSQAAATVAPASEARAAMQLLGIAEDSANGATVRTAIVSAAGQLFCVREGERVLGRYEVVRVAADAVELKDGSATFTLALK